MVKGGVPGGSAGLGSSVVTATAWGCCCDTGSIPGPRTSACLGWGQKKKKKSKGMKGSSQRRIQKANKHMKDVKSPYTSEKQKLEQWGIH